MNRLEITHFPSLDYACAEAMNTLCTNLSYCGADIRTILFTSRYEHEGKSSIAMNVMRTLVSYGKNVLLVDADLRCSTLASRYRFHFASKEAYGLAQYLADLCDLEDVVYETNLPGAYILPAGREVLNSVQLLASPRFDEMIRAMKEQVDIILVDSPPAGVIVDAMEIAKCCDGAVLVVEYNKGRRQDIGEVAANIARTGCPVLGAVMNGVDLKSFGNRKYYYRSERYSGYYSHYGKSGRRAGRDAEKK
jgi:protein-tyrosine kinase